MILSRTKALFGSELKVRLTGMMDTTAGFLDKTRAELHGYLSRKARSKVFETF
jgi:hypothetical protein